MMNDPSPSTTCCRFRSYSVGCGDPGAQLAGNVGAFVFGEPADAAQRGRQIFPIHVLHRQIEQPLGVADVVHAADVRVGDLPRRAHLVVELREPYRIAAEIPGQEFQRALLVEAQVVVAIDLALATSPEQAAFGYSCRAINS